MEEEPTIHGLSREHLLGISFSPKGTLPCRPPKKRERRREYRNCWPTTKALPAPEMVTKLGSGAEIEDIFYLTGTPPGSAKG